MSEVLACPFCRERYQGGKLCLHCDIALIPATGIQEKPSSVWPDDYVVRPLSDLRNARGLLLLIAALSLAAFAFSPWVYISTPYVETRSGLGMARHGLGWLWGGAIGWTLCGALLLAQRSPFQMRKLRPLLFVMAAMTASEVGLLLALPPAQSAQVRFEYHFGWGLYVALGLAILGCLTAIGFGGVRHRESSPRATSPGSSSAPTDQAIH